MLLQNLKVLKTIRLDHLKLLKIYDTIKSIHNLEGVFMEFILGVLYSIFILLSFFAVIQFWMKLAAALGDILGISKLIDFIIKKLFGD